MYLDIEDNNYLQTNTKILKGPIPSLKKLSQDQEPKSDNPYNINSACETKGLYR